MPPRPKWDVGNLVDWLGVPIIVLSTPVFGRPKQRDVDVWHCRAAYLRDTLSGPRCGKIVDEFNISDKSGWSDNISGEEAALAMQLLLTDA